MPQNTLSFYSAGACCGLYVPDIFPVLHAGSFLISESAYCSGFFPLFTIPQSLLSSDIAPAPAYLLHYNNTPSVRPFLPLPDDSIPSVSNSSSQTGYGLRGFLYCSPELLFYVSDAVSPLSSWTEYKTPLPPFGHPFFLFFHQLSEIILCLILDRFAELLQHGYPLFPVQMRRQLYQVFLQMKSIQYIRDTFQSSGSRSDPVSPIRIQIDLFHLIQIIIPFQILVNIIPELKVCFPTVHSAEIMPVCQDSASAVNSLILFPFVNTDHFCDQTVIFHSVFCFDKITFLFPKLQSHMVFIRIDIQPVHFFFGSDV